MYFNRLTERRNKFSLLTIKLPTSRIFKKFIDPDKAVIIRDFRCRLDLWQVWYATPYTVSTKNTITVQCQRTSSSFNIYQQGPGSVHLSAAGVRFIPAQKGAGIQVILVRSAPTASLLVLSISFHANDVEAVSLYGENEIPRERRAKEINDCRVRMIKMTDWPSKRPSADRNDDMNCLCEFLFH